MTPPPATGPALLRLYQLAALSPVSSPQGHFLFWHISIYPHQIYCRRFPSCPHHCRDAHFSIFPTGSLPHSGSLHKDRATAFSSATGASFPLQGGGCSSIFVSGKAALGGVEEQDHYIIPITGLFATFPFATFSGVTGGGFLSGGISLLTGALAVIRAEIKSSEARTAKQPAGVCC